MIERRGCTRVCCYKGGSRCCTIHKCVAFERLGLKNLAGRLSGRVNIERSLQRLVAIACLILSSSSKYTNARHDECKVASHEAGVVSLHQLPGTG